MNIFVVSEDPELAARSLHDRHVVKMVLESAQLLCSAAWFYGIPAPYRPTHLQHPCSIWLRESNANAQWLIRHSLALCAEYTYRYGKRHKSQDVIEAVQGQLLGHLPEGPLTPWAQVMPEECRMQDPILAYREYYRSAKVATARYTHRHPPDWLEGIAVQQK